MRNIFKIVNNKIRLFMYRFWLSITYNIMTIANDSHKYRTTKIIDCICLSKEIYDKYCDYLQKRELSKHYKEIKYYDKRINKYNKLLLAEKNKLIDIIMKSNDIFTIKKKNSNEVIDEEYLYNMDIEKLIDTTENIINNIKLLDL